MKIYGPPGMTLVSATETTDCAPTNRSQPTNRQADGVSLDGISQVRETMQANGNDGEIDLERVSAVFAQMIDGNYHVAAEKVADAIIEEASWLELWLR